MRTAMLLIGLVACLLLVASSEAKAPSEEAADSRLLPRGGLLPRRGGIYYKIVRAAYVDWSGNADHVDTTCFITNTSTSTPISLKAVYVLGPDGVNSLIATYGGLIGTTLMPLAQVNLRINNSIPGVSPQTLTGNLNEFGVRSVVVGWGGPQDALKLSAEIVRTFPGQYSERVKVAVQGHALTP